MLVVLTHRTVPQEAWLQPVCGRNRLKPGLPLRSRAGAISISGLIVSRSLPHDGRDGGPGQHLHDTPLL